MYHKVDKSPETIWWVSIDSFYQQLLSLSSKQVTYLDKYDPFDITNYVITFDGLYQNVVKYAAPLLYKLGYPFEVFITSDYIGTYNSFDECEPTTNFANLTDLKKIEQLGGRLQWHTRSHQSLSELDSEASIISELTVPSSLRDHFSDLNFKWFAYPYGNFNERVLDLVKQVGYHGAVSCNQGNDTNKFCLNRITVTEESNFFDYRVSVIIASYNYGSYLIDAFNSVLRQSLKPSEILISDDCSSDNTYDIAKEIQRRYPDLVRVNRNEKNLGIVDHFNKAISLTSGEFVCILGADNRYRSDFIEKTYQILSDNLRCAIAYTDFALFGKRASVVYQSFPLPRQGKIKSDMFYIINFPDFDDNTKATILTSNNFIHGSSLFKRSVFDLVGGYKYEPDQPEDHNLFQRIIKSGWDARRVPLPLLEYRQHSKLQANIKVTSYAEINFYRSLCKSRESQLEQTQSQLEQTQSQLEQTQSQLEQTQSQLHGMESSKFWKIRQIWFKVQHKMGITRN